VIGKQLTGNYKIGPKYSLAISIGLVSE